MSVAECPRSFEAEALRDRRLGEDERSSFERHAASCPACARELRAFERLAERVRARVPGDDVDELHVRRERTRLLAAFDGVQVAPERIRSRAWLLAPVLAVVLIAAFFGFRRGKASTTLAGSASFAAVQADAASVWSERVEGDLERITLQRGSLRIHVNHTAARGRVVVILPDGELEDVGTTFTVSAEGGRTTRVVVEDGRVVLRVRGERDVTVAAGETWTNEARAVSAPSVASLPPSAAAVPPPRLDIAPNRQPLSPENTPVSRPGAPLASPGPSSRADEASSGPDPAADFRAALAALHAGNHAGAAAAFAEFLAKYPRGSRGEDAAYLRVIALQRSGNAAATKQAAAEYLARFPSGFRRADVEALQ